MHLDDLNGFQNDHIIHPQWHQESDRNEEKIRRRGFDDTRRTKHLDDCDEAKDLEEAEPDKELLHSPLLDSNIVKSCHFGAAKSLGDTGEHGDVLDDHAGGSKHAHAAMLELSLTKPLEVDDA